MGKTAKIHTYYQIKENKVLRAKKECPRCGRGFFMAEHLDRWSCGRCTYTEFKPPKKG